MLLALYTNLIRADRQVRSGIWDREGNRGLELKGSTVGIIGYGNTGKAFARKLKGFEVQILAYDKYLKQYSDDYAKESNMEEIYAQCDAISFHVPLTDETRYLGNSGYFESFAKPIKVLNLSRGKVVRLQDLVSMMKIGKVSGAALDVFENEQIGKLSETEQAVFDELIHSGKTVLTPHIGGWTVESYKKISLVLLQKIKELTGGNGS
jgi:D-3-phosphoglycerate dehydrogenase